MNSGNSGSMNAERWRQLDQLLDAVLERAPAERAALLAEACAGDEALRRQIESLLRSAEAVEGFIETPAVALAAELMAEKQAPPLLPGQRLNHYSISTQLGAGGMGEVYQAHDTRLGRAIALKVLPVAFAQDADRLRRFAQEARAISALNHPNIVTLHEVGEAAGVHYLATEFVDGLTLRERLTNGKFELQEALEIVIQMASGLAVAHEAGIIHRDIKPENVMLRRDGIVKVLDFGLAKLKAQSEVQATASANQATLPGLVMGTVGYMSPEQLRGQLVDARTDIFSLSVVLYELVTGRAPFAGATVAEVAAAVLHTEPAPLPRYMTGLPPELERIVRSGLQKEPELRFQSAKDLLVDLKNLKLELAVAAKLRRSGAPAMQPESKPRTLATPPPPDEISLPWPPLPSSRSNSLRALLEPAGGAVPLNSGFYMVRQTDEKFRAAIARQDSIVLVKGSRQVGKTSLLARGLQQAREHGAQVVVTDFQNLSAAELGSAEKLLFSLADSFAEQLDLDVVPQHVWKAGRSPGINFEQFLRREVLAKIAAPLVWGLDEVDRLFTCSFGSEIFGLFRSWHNKRALDPAGPWSRLTLAIAYATEAHLFITDLNQSPFNVGTRLQLEDFSFEQVADLNQRYGTPLREPAEVARFFHLLSGHPYLVRRGLYELVNEACTPAALEAQAAHDEGPFGDHLRRLVVSLTQDRELCEVVRGLLQGRPCPTAESFYRLRSAGLVIGDAARDARLRCQLYTAYLEKHLL
jgi:serine/threonine protein kinase